MKIARRVLLVFAAVALALGVLTALFYALEDWRGTHAWEMCRHELQARGEKLDLSAFIPPPVPDDQNLAMAPLFVRMYRYQVDPETGLLTFPAQYVKNDLAEATTNMPHGAWKPGQPDYPRGVSEWTGGRTLDLAAWQHYFRQRADFPRADSPRSPAEDVLLALTKYAPVLDELAQAAASRPLTRFPIDWTAPQPATIRLPHYNALQRLTETLRLRATANLALGRNDAAMRDLMLARRLIEIPAADPIMIAQLVSAMEFGMMTQPIWEGLKTRRWSGGELQEIKTGLRGLDYLAGYRETMRFERVVMLGRTIDYFKAHGGVAETFRMVQGTQGEDGENDRLFRWWGWFIETGPSGWYDQNRAIGSRFIQEHQIDLLDPVAHRVWLAKTGGGAMAARQMPITPYTWLVHIMVPVYDSVLTKMASYQADADHMMIACALEQFFLDRHDYPARLEELVPGYLDRVDMMDGAPTRYRRTEDGRYTLYSVGWNGRDDHGQMAWRKGGVKRDDAQGDWIWQYQEIKRPAPVSGK